MEMKHKAKKAMLNALKKKMREMGGKQSVGEGLGVTVKAKDKKGLAEGLEKAQELVESPKLDKMIGKAKEAAEEHLEGSEVECPLKEMPSEELEEKINALQEELDSREG